MVKGHSPYCSGPSLEATWTTFLKNISYRKMQGVGGFNLPQITNSSTPAQYQTKSLYPCRKSSSPKIWNVSSNHISEQMQSQILIQKFMSQILDLYIGLIRTFSEKKLQHSFPKMRGGWSKAQWDLTVRDTCVFVWRDQTFSGVESASDVALS